MDINLRLGVKFILVMKNKIILVAAFFSVLLLACNLDSLPNEFPNEVEFAQILADVHFAEAAINQIRIKERGVDSAVNNYYHHVLAKHNLTQEKFDTIVSWYSSHPQIYQDVYEDAIALLSEREAEWEREVKQIKAEEERVKKVKEARNVWKNKKNYFINLKDTFDRRIPFDIVLDTIEADGYRLSAYYQFLKGSMIKDPSLEILTLYADSTLDTISYKLPITHINTKAELMIGVDKELKILRMQGFLVNHDTTKEIRTRIKDIEFEYIPKEDTISVQ